MSKGLVLVTGITGFVGTEVALTFLRSGYRVRGTGRSAAQLERWIGAFPEHKDAFEFTIVPDMAADGAFDEAVKGADYVAHTASPFHFHIEDNEKDMLIPALKGTTGILASIEKAPTVKHLVVTSSFAAIGDIMAIAMGQVTEKVYTDDDWNPATWETAKGSDNAAYVYCASKKIAEQAVWDYVEAKKPSYGVTTINPPMIYGPPSQPVSSLKGLNTSTSDIWKLISGELKEVPETPIPTWSDVRDVALAHVRAVEVPAARNQRYLMIEGHFSFDQAAHVLHKNFPELSSRVPPSKNTPPGPHHKSNSSKVQRELGITFKTFEQTITDTAARLLELEKKLGTA
jgi:nucleoside-diphosphate-sugar epimerase